MGGEAKAKMFDFSLGKQLKKNYSLYPIVFIGIFGISLSAFQIIRTLSRSPDVAINKKGNPKPYEHFITPEGKAIQYKYYTTKDFAKVDIEKPKI